MTQITKLSTAEAWWAALSPVMRAFISSCYPDNMQKHSLIMRAYNYSGSWKADFADFVRATDSHNSIL